MAPGLRLASGAPNSRSAVAELISKPSWMRRLSSTVLVTTD
jgi:hypothetical protein